MAHGRVAATLENMIVPDTDNDGIPHVFWGSILAPFMPANSRIPTPALAPHRVEHAKHLGRMNWFDLNTGVINARHAEGNNNADYESL